MFLFRCCMNSGCSRRRETEQDVAGVVPSAGENCDNLLHSRLLPSTAEDGRRFTDYSGCSQSVTTQPIVDDLVGVNTCNGSIFDASTSLHAAEEIYRSGESGFGETSSLHLDQSVDGVVASTHECRDYKSLENNDDVELTNLIPSFAPSKDSLVISSGMCSFLEEQKQSEDESCSNNEECSETSPEVKYIADKIQFQSILFHTEITCFHRDHTSLGTALHMEDRCITDTIDQSVADLGLVGNAASCVMPDTLSQTTKHDCTVLKMIHPAAFSSLPSTDSTQGCYQPDVVSSPSLLTNTFDSVLSHPDDCQQMCRSTSDDPLGEHVLFSQQSTGDEKMEDDEISLTDTISTSDDSHLYFVYSFTKGLPMKNANAHEQILPINLKHVSTSKSATTVEAQDGRSTVRPLLADCQVSSLEVVHSDSVGNLFDVERVLLSLEEVSETMRSDSTSPEDVNISNAGTCNDDQVYCADDSIRLGQVDILIPTNGQLQQVSFVPHGGSPAPTNEQASCDTTFSQIITSATDELPQVSPSDTSAVTAEQYNCDTEVTEQVSQSNLIIDGAKLSDNDISSMPLSSFSCAGNVEVAKFENAVNVCLPIASELSVVHSLKSGDHTDFAVGHDNLSSISSRNVQQDLFSGSVAEMSTHSVVLLNCDINEGAYSKMGVLEVPKEETVMGVLEVPKEETAPVIDDNFREKVVSFVEDVIKNVVSAVGALQNTVNDEFKEDCHPNKLGGNGANDNLYSEQLSSFSCSSVDEINFTSNQCEEIAEKHANVDEPVSIGYVCDKATIRSNDNELGYENLDDTLMCYSVDSVDSYKSHKPELTACEQLDVVTSYSNTDAHDETSSEDSMEFRFNDDNFIKSVVNLPDISTYLINNGRSHAASDPCNTACDTICEDQPLWSDVDACFGGYDNCHSDLDQQYMSHGHEVKDEGQQHNNLCSEFVDVVICEGILAFHKECSIGSSDNVAIQNIRHRASNEYEHVNESVNHCFDAVNREVQHDQWLKKLPVDFERCQSVEELERDNILPREEQSAVVDDIGTTVVASEVSQFAEVLCEKREPLGCKSNLVLDPQVDHQLQRLHELVSDIQADASCNTDHQSLSTAKCDDKISNITNCEETVLESCCSSATVAVSQSNSGARPRHLLPRNCQSPATSSVPSRKFSPTGELVNNFFEQYVLPVNKTALEPSPVCSPIFSTCNSTDDVDADLDKLELELSLLDSDDHYGNMILNDEPTHTIEVLNNDADEIQHGELSESVFSSVLNTTPRRKKSVRFADAIGQDLVSIRRIEKSPTEAALLANIKDILPGLLDATDRRARWAERHPRQGVTATAWHSETPAYLHAMFISPGTLSDFLDRVRLNRVMLESCSFDDAVFAISGLVRVANISYHKNVSIRYTLDSWITFADVDADYIPRSNDGTTDRFAFTIILPPRRIFGIGKCMEFAVCYSAGEGDNVEMHWDNNSGHNYIIECCGSKETIADQDGGSK